MAEKNAVWIVYDGRAIFGDTDDAAVLESFGYPDCKDDEDAKRQARRTWKGHEFALYRYDLNEKREAYNERLILVNDKGNDRELQAAIRDADLRHWRGW